MTTIKYLEKCFVQQQDQSDCGVACLLSVIRFHDSDESLEILRKLSGTSKEGTTMLGLIQASQALGFDAEGLEAENIKSLEEINEPAILHVVLDNRHHHYVVFFPFPVLSDNKFIIGDPAKGVIQMGKDELNSIWQSRALLRLLPNSLLKKKHDLKKSKKKWIIELIKDDSPLLVVALILGIIFSALGITTAIFSQKLIDDILPTENTRKLVISMVLVTFLMLSRSSVGYIRSIFIAQQSYLFNNRIIEKFYSTLLELPKSFFDTRKIGELIARMNDTRRIQSVISVVLSSIVIDFLVIIISLSFIFYYSSMIGSLLLCALPVYLMMLIRYNKPFIQKQKELMVGNAISESYFIETMQGVSVIKQMNRQLFFSNVNSQVYGEFQRRVLSLMKLNIRFGFISEVTGVFILILVFGLTSWLVLSKQLKIGEMVALLTMASAIIPSIHNLVSSNIQIQGALVAFDRMFEFTSIQKEESNAESLNYAITNDDSQLMLSCVSFRFPGRKEIIKDVSMKIRTGEMVALLGETGTGKSTLLDLIQKFYKIERGSILVDQIDINELNTFQWRRQLATVPQEVKIFNGSLYYNITLSDKPEDYQSAIELCEKKGFTKYFSEFPQGYLTLLGEEGINISGGQKQLIGLARALFCKPKFLLLDEATSSMDRKMENFVLALLEDEKKVTGVLMVTHRKEVASHCDRYYYLQEGVVTSSGSSAQLKMAELLS